MLKRLNQVTENPEPEVTVLKEEPRFTEQMLLNQVRKRRSLLKKKKPRDLTIVREEPEESEVSVTKLLEAMIELDKNKKGINLEGEGEDDKSLDLMSSDTEDGDVHQSLHDIHKDSNPAPVFFDLKNLKNK